MGFRSIEPPPRERRRRRPAVEAAADTTDAARLDDEVPRANRPELEAPRGDVTPPELPVADPLALPIGESFDALPLFPESNDCEALSDDSVVKTGGNGALAECDRAASERRG